MHMRRAILVLLLLFSIPVCSVVSHGEDLQLPPGTGPIPELQNGSKGGLLVFSEHASKYAGVLPDEVADLVARGQLVLEVARQPLPDRKGLEGPGTAPNAMAVQQSGVLSGLSGPLTPEIFSKESVTASEGNKVEQSFKVLWNAASAPWARGVIFERAILTLFPSNDSEGRVVEFSVSRVLSALIGGAMSSAGALFRERVSLLSPVSLRGISWLTFRFFGLEEDYMWASSALIRRTRQMTGSNRSDALFAGAFAPDDLFVWSGKVEGLKPLRIEQRVMLVATSPAQIALAKRDNGKCLSAQVGRQGFELNRDSQRFKQHPGWMPTGVRFSPRRVWKVDVASLDPFSRDTLQSLVIDQETLFPVYRTVWGPDGRLRKVVFGVLGSLGTESISVPWLMGQVIAYPETGMHSVIGVSEISMCSEMITGTTADDLDPSSLVEPEPTHAPRVVTAAVEGEEVFNLEDDIAGRD